MQGKNTVEIWLVLEVLLQWACNEVELCCIEGYMILDVIKHSSVNKSTMTY